MRHYFDPASDGSEKAQTKKRRLTRLSTLSVRQILVQLEQVEYQLRNPLFLHEAQLRGLKKRKADLSVELTERILEAKYKAKEKALRLSINGVDEALFAFLTSERNPIRKAQCKAPNRGHYRPPPPSPTGKTVGAFRVIRPKGKVDKLRKPK